MNDESGGPNRAFTTPKKERDASRLVTPNQRDEDGTADRSLRPRKLEDYVGQDRVKDNLRIFIQAALEREEALDHVLLYGPP
ncbi:MAG TPA: hypothetical protein VNP95_02595, partial [Thermomicrobiales bacterium]|nr:hypothetical protein [Thermomicrobiales bacterium]